MLSIKCLAGYTLRDEIHMSPIISYFKIPISFHEYSLLYNFYIYTDIFCKIDVYFKVIIVLIFINCHFIWDQYLLLISE